MPQIKNQRPQLLYNGEYTEFGTRIDAQENLEPIIDHIKAAMAFEPEDHKIVLRNATLTYEKESCFWTLTFQGTTISLADIDNLFLKPIAAAWDMNLIDQQFDLISISHNRKTKIDTIIIGIRSYD